MKKFLLCFIVSFCVHNLAVAESKIVSAIEIGSKGIKAIAYELSGVDGDGQYASKKIFDKKINPTIMSGVVDGYLKDEKIKEATSVVRDLFGQLKGLDPQFVVIVSSTAFDKIKNKTVLENAIKEATGQDIRFITSDQEMYYGLLSCVPQNKINSSILIDIGSGNTKLGYATPMSVNGFESITFKYGTVTLKEAASASTNLNNGLVQIYQNDISPSLRQAIQDKPGLANVNRRVYIVGGASWAVANLARPQDIDKPYVTLKLSEVKDINRKLLSGSYVPASENQKANATISNIMDVFTSEDLQAGSTLLASLLSDLNADRRKIIFPRDGGWVVGYMFANFNSKNN